MDRRINYWLLQNWSGWDSNIRFIIRNNTILREHQGRHGSRWWVTVRWLVAGKVGDLNHKHRQSVPVFPSIKSIFVPLGGIVVINTHAKDKHWHPRGTEDKFTDQLSDVIDGSVVSQEDPRWRLERREVQLAFPFVIVHYKTLRWLPVLLA